MREVKFNCPICEVEIRLPESENFTTCHSCRTHLDVKSLLAYLRGLEAFDEGQEVMLQVSPRARRTNWNAQDRMAMTLFREAYSSLQLAFEGDLVEDQRQLAIEMMSSMSMEFSKRAMVSVYEGRYWSAAMAELTSQNEYTGLKEKLRRTRATFYNFFVRWHWRQRQRQLFRVLQELDRKLGILEEQIEFVNLPRARNRHWKP